MTAMPVTSRQKIAFRGLLVSLSPYFGKCLHKTGRALAYTPSKCVRIVECCCRLHNRAIEDRIPAPAAGQVPIYSDNDTFNAETIVNAVNIKNIVVRRF
uniref:DDE Tnp4 domain-containing protein n=1 Tax=Magallana gigas TaxID=29159 RepID=A0A8W8LIQ9_MAGGI